MGVEVRLEGLGVSYGKQVVLDAIDLAVPAGGILSVVGLSGCGKSTLLKAVAGLLDGTDAALTGQISLDDRPAADARKSLAISMCFQRSFLFPWQTARQNILLHEQLHPGACPEGLVDKLLSDIGLSADGHKYPAELSGGMQQRVALAREFARKPDILLLDEPFSGLDCVTREQLNDYVLHFWTEYKPTLIMVTHDPEEAIYIADQIKVLTHDHASSSSQQTVKASRPRSRAMRQSTEFRSQVEWTIEKLRQASM